MNHIKARDGKVVMNGVECSTPEEVAAVFLEQGPSGWMCSSSVDFCEENGFDNIGDADKLLEKGGQLYQLKNVGVLCD